MTGKHQAKYLVQVLAFLLLGAWAYSNTLNAPFYFDDGPNIIKNQALHLESLSPSSIFRAASEATVPSRPLANISFALNYYFHGYDLRGYHLVNISIHILTGIFLFFLFHALLASSAIRTTVKYPILTAFLGALLWLVHPLQTQAVTYVVQRMTSMAAMFYILAMLLYAQGRSADSKQRSIAWLTGSAIAGILALGSKEIAATLPLFILLYEWFFLQDLHPDWLKKWRWQLIGGTIGMVLIAIILLGTEPLSTIQSGYHYKDFTIMGRVLTEARVVFFYLGLFLLPLSSRLSLEHDLLPSTSLFSPPTTLPAVTAILLLLAAAVLLARKHRLPAFALIWFLGNLVIESTIIPLELVFEHRMYLPSMFLYLLISFYLLKYCRMWLEIGIMTILIGVSAGWTHSRNEMWTDTLEFHRSNVRNAAGNYRAQYNYGLELYAAGRYEEAIARFQKILALEPRHIFAHKDLGQAYTMIGAYDKARREFEEVLRVAPDHAPTLVALGYLYTKQGIKQKAISFYLQALRQNPANGEIHKRLGYLYADIKEFENAAAHFEQALTDTRSNAFELHNNLGIIYASMGNYDQSINHFELALELRPDDEKIRHNLDIARREKLRQE